MEANLKNEKFFLNLIKKGKLRVTKSGRAFNLVTGRELAKRKNIGYRSLSWLDTKTNKIKRIQLHRLIWAFFKGTPKDPKLVINHIDGNKQECKLRNLELTCNSVNVCHAISTGLNKPLKGEEKPNSIFSNKEVKRLRKYFSVYDVTHRELASELKVHSLTLFCMLRGDTYKHIESKYTKHCRSLLPKVGRGQRLA
jgi:hypothetical protein